MTGWLEEEESYFLMGIEGPLMGGPFHFTKTFNSLSQSPSKFPGNRAIAVWLTQEKTDASLARTDVLPPANG